MSRLAFEKPVSLFGIFSAMGLVLTAPVLAQTPSSSGTQLEEIVVTARRTSEKLQTTPVAVTAISPQSLIRRQIEDVIDLQRSVPNLSIGGAGTLPASGVSLAIRGEAQNSNNSASDAAVGIYIDGIYFARATSANLGLLDMSGAEVLRGPQGTLFGRNTTGGALNLTTQTPTGKFEGSVKTSIGNYDLREAEAVVNVPLNGDELAARMAARYTEHGGYGYNPVTNRRMGDVDSDYYARMAVKWAPSHLPLTVTLRGDYSKYKDNGVLTAITLNLDHVFVPAGSVVPGVFPASDVTMGTLFAANGLPNPTQYNNGKDNFYRSFGDPNTGIPGLDSPLNRNLAKGASATVEAELGDIHLKSITAYREANSANAMDLDGTPLEVVGFLTQYTQRQFTQEIQLSGKAGSLDWMTGLFHFNEKGSEQSDNQILQALFGGVFGGNAPHFRSLAEFRAASTGVYAQINYHFTDRLRATGGFRYTWDTRNLNRHGLTDVDAGICGVGPNTGMVVGTSCNDPHTANFQYPAWLASLDYQVDDQTFVYLKTSGASMAGGFNTRPTPIGLDSFEPEHVKDIEAGIKSDLFDRKLRTNAALFYSWRNGVQNIVNEFSNGVLTQYVRNAGNVRAYGAEFEGTLLPWDGMEINAAAAYLHTSYVKGTFVVNGLAGPVDRSGELVQQAPKWTWNLGAAQSFDLPWGKFSIHADYSYLSSRPYYQDTVDPSNPAQSAAEYAVANDLGVIKGYGILNARMAFNLNEPDIEIAFWGRNLTNEKYYVNMFNGWTSLGFQEDYQGVPRIYGVSVAYHW